MYLIHSDDRATINSVAAVLDGVTYPLRAVAAIETRELPEQGGCLRVFLWALALFMSFFAILYLSPEITHRQAGLPVNQGFVRAGLMCATVAIGVGALAWLNKPRRLFALVVTTAAGEKAAVVSEDAAYVAFLREAMERALVLASSSSGADSAAGGTHPQ
jgi:hypothetical protein